MKEMKSIKDREQWKEGKKITVTTRLDAFMVFGLDKIVEKVGGTKTSNAVKILEEGISEGLIALGYDFESLKDEYFSKDGGGVFIDGVKVDPSEVSDLLANPEKFGVPVHEMTEEEAKEQEAREEAEKIQEGK
jgi:hypothetical protein